MELFLHDLQRVEFMAKIYYWTELNSVLEEALLAMAQVAWSVAYQIWRSKMALVSKLRYTVEILTVNDKRLNEINSLKDFRSSLSASD